MTRDSGLDRAGRAAAPILAVLTLAGCAATQAAIAPPGTGSVRIFIFGAEPALEAACRDSFATALERHGFVGGERALAGVDIEAIVWAGPWNAGPRRVAYTADATAMLRERGRQVTVIASGFSEAGIAANACDDAAERLATAVAVRSSSGSP